MQFEKNKAPGLSKWVDSLITTYKDDPIPNDMKSVERDLICSMEDWVIYVTTTDDYHNQPFANWDERGLRELTSYSDLLRSTVLSKI